MSDEKCSASASSAWLEELFGDTRERTGAEEIDHDGHGDDRKSIGRGLDRVRLLAKKPDPRLVGDTNGKDKQQSGFGERGHAFHFAMAVLVLGVGRLAGDAHRRKGEHGRREVEQRMTGLRQDRERAGQHADNRLAGGQCRRCGDRCQRGFFLFVHVACDALLKRLCRPAQETQ